MGLTAKKNSRRWRSDSGGCASASGVVLSRSKLSLSRKKFSYLPNVIRESGFKIMREKIAAGEPWPT
jgi:hypothetical protein